MRRLNKKHWVIIIAVVLAAAAAVASWIGLHKQINQATKREMVVTVVADMPPMTMLTAENVKLIDVPLSSVNEHTVKAPADIIGQITTVPLFSGGMIDKRVIAQPSILGNCQLVGIYTDPARYAGVQENDVVDVYWVQQDKQPLAAVIIAKDAKVYKIADEAGSTIKSNNVVTQAVNSATKAPKIVYLLVKPEEAPYVINGAIDNKTMALVKKSLQGGAN